MPQKCIYATKNATIWYNGFGSEPDGKIGSGSGLNTRILDLSSSAQSDPETDRGFFSTAGSDPDPASIGLDPETLCGIYGENFLISGWSPILIFNPISLTIDNTAVRLNIIPQNCTRNL